MVILRRSDSPFDFDFSVDKTRFTYFPVRAVKHLVAMGYLTKVTRSPAAALIALQKRTAIAQNLHR